jgi:hemoglobin-like flavoprotein
MQNNPPGEYQHHIQIVESSLQKAHDEAGVDVLAAQLFARFFECYPETQRYFEQTDVADFGPRKFGIIAEFLIDTLKHPQYAEGHICNEVMRHTMYGLKDKEYYFALVDAFRDSVKTALGESWNEEMEACWHDAVEGLKATIFAAAKDFL